MSNLRLDAALFFTIAKPASLSWRSVPLPRFNLLLPPPKGHPLTRLKKLRLRDLGDAAFIWFPRRESPALLTTAHA